MTTFAFRYVSYLLYDPPGKYVFKEIKYIFQKQGIDEAAHNFDRKFFDYNIMIH